MATDKQHRANRANAKRSSGPRTENGKQRSSINAVGHGLNQDLNLLTQPEITQLQNLFEADGLTADESLTLAQAHCARARVRAARNQAWAVVFNNEEITSGERGELYDASPEYLARLDSALGGKYWRKIMKHKFEKPFSNMQDRVEQITLQSLDKQRRLNRYDVKAVSTLSKLYKKAYSIK
jgi:hypothetical protein